MQKKEERFVNRSISKLENKLDAHNLDKQFSDLSEENKSTQKAIVNVTAEINKISTTNYCTSSAIADQLFLEMCERGHIVEDPGTLSKRANDGKVNYYYPEAAKYALRISAGNFEGKNKRYKPVFHLESKDLSQELREILTDCLKTSKESLHEVVQEGVFKLLRARHKMVFYEHIEGERLRWKFN